MKKIGAAVAIIVIFLIPLASGPTLEDRFSFSDRQKASGDDYLLSGWEEANSGNGDPLIGNLNGFRVTSGTSTIDATHPGYIGIDPPLGWSSEQLEGQLDHLSMWVDDVLVNPSLDAYHEELWFPIDGFPEYNSDSFFVPDGWTFIKNDALPSGTEHPQHGYFELNGRVGDGYDTSIGWRFDANYGSSATFDPSMGIYMSQQVPAPWRGIYSAEITFLYYVASLSDLNDEVFIFTRLEDYVSKHHVFEIGTPTDTWIQAKATVPSSFLQSLEVLDSLLFDIGIGTDMSGLPSGSSDHEVFIDEIELKLLVRPFPEQIDLLANGAKITGSTPGSVTPYVPDASNRDCYSEPGGIDLNGYSDNGWLDVGADVPLYPDWSTAFAYQVGVQFPLHVPQGAAITSAHLQVEAVSDSTGFPGMRVYVANEDDVPAFTSGYPILPERYNWVNTSVYWRPTTWSTNGRYDTPDVSALIQEVVSRPGWQSGNYICLMVGYSYSNQQYTYNQIKGSTGFAQADLARLFVDFVESESSDTIPSFRFNKNIVIDHTKVTANLQDFPVLIDIWDEDLHFNTQPDGDDISFIFDGQVINHEIELFDKRGNGTHAHLVCWVKIPQLSSVIDTTIVMVYGDDDLGSQEDPESLWDSGFSAVCHLIDNPAQPQWDSTYSDYLPHQPQILDSTSPITGGTTYGTMTSTDRVSGFIGDAIDLDGVNDYIDFGNPAELQIAGAFTVEAWFSADFIDNDYLVVKSGESNYRGWDISFDDDPSISPAGWVMFRFSPDGVNTDTVGYERVDTNQWYHVVGVFVPSTYAKFYLNGELVGEMTTGVPSSVNNPNRPVRIGRRSDNPGGTSYLDTIVDEVRISSVARSEAWIATQYNNQRNPELFITVGEEGVNFRYMKDITIDHNKVASNLAGFPVLIDIFDTDLRTDVQTDGDDIMFTSNGRSLPHEIEVFDKQYNSTHAHLVAWVRADLSSASDTILTMYYDNPLIGSQENPDEVWRNSYQGVWHLGESTGDATDSTSFGTDGTLSGGVTQGVAAQIGNGYDFDGTDGEINMGDPTNGHLDVGDNDLTVSMWIKIDQSTGTWQIPINKGHPSALDSGYRFETNTNGQTIYFQISDGGSYESSNTQSVTFGTWMHFVGRLERNSNEMHLFKDGSYSGFVDISAIGSISSTDNLTISRGLHLSAPVDGILDEIRISNIAFSDGWVATEYANQYDPSSFYSVGVETLVQPMEFARKKDIVVDHNKVNSDLTDFPLLIDIFDTDLRTDVQSDGDDIIFGIGATALPHEVELFEQTYNSTHAHLVAWVKANLSSSVDTTVTMYYGNPGMVNQESPSDVWNSNYAAVWHMNQDPSSSDILDSTSNGYDLTAIGFSSDQRIHNEMLGTAISVDGINDRFGISGISGPINDFTFQSWFKFDNAFPPGSEMHFFRGNSLTNDYPLMRFASSGVVVTEIEVTSDPEESCTGNKNSWAADTWFQFAFTRSMSAVRAYHYVNGSLDAEDNSADNANPHLAWNQFVILSDFSGGNMWGPGAISEFRILNIPLSPDWIAAEYANQHDPASFYSIGAEEQSSIPPEPSVLDATGYNFSTSSESSVTIGVKLSLGVQTSAFSYADDLTIGTSFSIVNGSLPVWTANVLVSPPPEIEEVSIEISYPKGEWYPTSVTSPSGVEKSFTTDWTCFDGKLIVGANAIDEYGMWQIQFQDRNHIINTLMGPTGGPYSSSSEFSVGEDIEFRAWSSGTMSSAISLELTDPSGSAWYSGSTTFQGQRFTLPYNHRKYVTISHYDVASDLVNFPVLVDLYDTDLRTDVRTDGRDIAFAIGEETLAHEIELFDPSFNSTHAHLAAWVTVPLLSGSSDTVISMYYGNPMAPIVYDSGPVWDSGYLGVWHLSESGAGAPDEYLDSGQYKNHGQGGEGNTSYVPTQVSGRIGFGQDFNNLDGYYDLIDCGDSPLWNIDGYQITLEAWIQHDITPNTHVYGIMNHKGWYSGYSLFINYGGGSTLKPTFSLPGDTHHLRGVNDVTGGSWHHIVATYDGSLMRIYVDGVQNPLDQLEKYDAILPSIHEQGFWIGHGDQPKDKVWSAEWEGQIDEVRISDVTRSAGWIQTQFQNHYDPSSFYSMSSEQTIGYSDSAAIALDSSAPAGIWQATARYSDSGSDVNHRAGIFSRNFVVRHGATLSLAEPGDAVSDGISAKLIGESLYVEYELSDILNSDPISGATMAMNWTVSGIPTQVQLNDYGDGRYGKTLNTSDLGAYGRWRIEIETSHPFYANATDYFHLDLSHQTYLTYEPPLDVPYGEDFEVILTLKDVFDNAPLAGASISSNGTIVGAPTDYGNGTYLVTIDSAGLSVGRHTFRFTVNPSSSYILSSSVDVQCINRPIATDATPLSSDTVETPWSQQATTEVFWYDLDNSNIGVAGGALSISPFVQTQLIDESGGFYNITIDVSSFAPGTYFFNLTFTKANYQTATVTVSVIVRIHRTAVSVEYDSVIPVGADVYFDSFFLDLDLGSIAIGSGNLSQVNLDWGTGNQNNPTYGFWLDTSSWAIGTYIINVTVTATDSPRYYVDSYILIELEIQKLNVFLSWEHLEPFPNGNDFVMVLHVNVSEPGSPIDGTPIAGLDQSYFSATNETSGAYTFKSFTNLGDGRYQLVIDSTRFLEGQYKIIIFVDFLISENYTDAYTPEVAFTYRPILAYLSSPEYPTVTTSFDTNVTLTLSYVDIDHLVNITIGVITGEGASIIWEHKGNGIYEVLIIVQGWDLGSHEVNLTADAGGYQAKTLTFEVLVQIAYAYARSSVSILDLPLGDTAVLFADYWDITHDEAIIGASISHNWTHALSISWNGEQYRIEIPSLNTDTLGSYLIMFNFSKGSNYQFGYFNISINLRTHSTEFRLASAVEPTSYNAMVNISVYCGDLDNDAGIVESSISLTVYGDSGLIPSTLENDTILGEGYYILSFAATNLGPSGIYDLTIYFNWTGPVQKYYNRTVAASVRIVGEASDLSLLDSAEPTPYLGNMSYTYLYSEFYSGIGISNSSVPAGNVFIYVEFLGHSISPSLISISEDIGNPGRYSIEFNSTIFNGPGLYTMTVYVNWSKLVDPFYGNWTDSISVRIIPRSTVVSVIPPESTAYGLDAIFAFSFDDVAEGTTERVANSSQMIVSIGLADYTISYNSSTRLFTVSFNTSVLGAPLGNRQFTISVSWSGSPFYSNVTGRTVIVSVTFRGTELDYTTIDPTSYGDNVTLHLTFTDVALGYSVPISDGLITLYNGSQEISASSYSVSPLGNGEYVIELNSTYFGKPGSYTLTVRISTSYFYYSDAVASRSLSLRYRLTLLVAEPVGEIAYNSSLEVVLHYSDVLSLAAIGNGSTPTSIQILNGSSWLFSSTWRAVSGNYLLIIDTYNQGLEINREYVLLIRMIYPETSPFYRSAERFISFTLKERATLLDLVAPPSPTPYLDNISLTLFFGDIESSNGITGAIMTLSIDAVDLVEGIDYTLQRLIDGLYYISINTTSLGSAGTSTSLLVRASWNSTAPYYSSSLLSLTLSVTQRVTITEILTSTTLVRFLENISFVFRYSDESTGQTIQLTKDQLLIFSEGNQLLNSDFSMMFAGSGYEISINSTKLNPGLISNWNLTIYVDWQAATAPYYGDSHSSIWVTVVNRVGVVIRGVAPTTPIHDLMNLTFRYIDDANGVGINDAIVAFDCLSPSGLIENIDYWVIRNMGNYSILVNTTRLGGLGTFTFSLRLLWNPFLVPYYRNTTTTYLQGSVRLIQTQLVNDEPNPSTVPINDNVSVVLTLQDTDHSFPISGAVSSFSVVYKTNESGPAVWSITPIGPGVYELVVDCSDAGATGTDALIITLSYPDYQTVEVQVPFQIRLRQGELNEFPPPTTYYGEETFVIVELVDIDAGNAPIDGAILFITWPDPGYTPDYTPLGSGLYNVSLTTAGLDAGLYTLIIGAQKSDYFISDISVPIQILNIPTEIILQQTIPDIYWGDDVSFWAFFNNTRDNSLISGASVVYQFGTLSGSLVEDLPTRNYSITIDTGNLAFATTYVVSITATLNNYMTITGQLTVNVLRLPIELAVVSEIQQEVFKGSPVNITVYVNNTYGDVPLMGATVIATWIAQGEQTITLSPVPGMDGYYTGFIDTNDLLVGEYVITIRASRTNFVTATASASVKIKQINTVLLLDAQTSAYSGRSFNWSDTIRIGVYVLAPSLNESYPYSTGLSNCTVIWSLSGTIYSGQFQNGTAIGGPGYFYFDFVTSDYSASTYTLRITAYPNVGMFAYSSNMTTLIVDPIETSVESTYLSPKIWGWTGNVNLTYWDILFDTGVVGAILFVDWAGGESVFDHIGNGTYRIFINTSLVVPGIYPISVIFLKDNYESGTGVFTLTVKEVPSDIEVYAPIINQIDGNVLNLEIPFGDTLPVTIFYNDTWYIRGIPGATETLGVIFGSQIPDREYLLIEELSGGNYSVMIDSTRWEVSSTSYRVVLSLYLGNWSRATINLDITIIDVPTNLQVDGSTDLGMSYSQTLTVWVFYSDAWPGHNGEGISGGSINATSLDSRFVVVSLNQSDPLRSGWYEIQLASGRLQGSVIVTIKLSKDNYESSIVAVEILVEPSEFDILLERALIYGVPIGFILLAGAILWTRLFSVPKLLRKLRGMVRAISKGKIPKPPEDILTRQEIVANLFNEIAESVGITKSVESMPSEAIATDVPEIEELLVQLSILSQLTPTELEDFKLDVSKMKLSEQVNFVKEVINQECIKRARAEGKTMESILAETADQARRLIAGEEIEEPEPVEVQVEPKEPEEPEETVPEPIDFEVVDSTDLLSKSELKEIRKELKDAGIKGAELATIMDQTRELPRELAEELLKIILRKRGEEE